MAKDRKSILLILFIIIAAAASGALFNMKETARKNRINAEDVLAKEKVLKNDASKQLSFTQQSRDQMQASLNKVKEEAQALEVELVNNKRQTEEAQQKMNEFDNKVSSTEAEIAQANSRIKELRDRIVSIAKDTLKLEGQLQLLQKTRDALKGRLSQFNKDKKDTEKNSPKITGTSSYSSYTSEESPQAPLGEAKAETPSAPRLAGEVLTVNREFNFVVINLGSGDGMKQGNVVDIRRDNKKLGQAEVETVRTNISAATLVNKESISQMRAGDKVFVY